MWRAYTAFVVVLGLAAVVIGLGHFAWYLGLGVLVVGAAVLGVYLTQPRSTNISIKTVGNVSQVDISIGDHRPSQPMILPARGMEIESRSRHRIVDDLGRTWILNDQQFAAYTSWLAREQSPADPMSWIEDEGLPFYTPGEYKPLGGYVGGHSIFPKTPGGGVDPFPGPYAPNSDVVKWAEDRAAREYRDQQKRDGVA